jgi:pimeloyl-ACP methyl ester carboxylesterase
MRMGGSGPIEAPKWWLTVSESRAWFELGAFAAASPALRLLGRGDRHPVLVLPGFTASDRSTEPLRWFLRGQGYWTHGWRLGRNMGPTQKILTGLGHRLQELHDRHDRPVSLVGWSLGGIYARELARRHPERVRLVITMGSPFRMEPGDRSAAEAVWNVARRRFSREMGGLLDPEHTKVPLAVPSTSIYTRTDGIVRWFTCLESEGERRESIEVRGSHSGLGFNPAVLTAVADRLAQREGHWQPFSPPWPLRYLYPEATTYRAA